MRRSIVSACALALASAAVGAPSAMAAPRLVADGSTNSTELGCTADDFGTATVIG